MLNPPIQHARVTLVGVIILLVAAIMLGLAAALPAEPNPRKPPPNPELLGFIAVLSAVGALGLAFLSASFRKQAKSVLAKELKRTGAQYYDIGFGTIDARGEFRGTFILSKENLYVIVPPPMPSGLIPAMMAQGNWDHLKKVTAEYSTLSRAIKSHPDWPLKKECEQSRMLIVPKSQVRSAGIPPDDNGILLATALGRLHLQDDRYSRDLVRQRWNKMQWPLAA